MKYVIVYQIRKEFSSNPPVKTDGMDCVLIVNEEQLSFNKACPFVVISQIFELGKELDVTELK